MFILLFMPKVFSNKKKFTILANISVYVNANTQSFALSVLWITFWASVLKHIFILTTQDVKREYIKSISALVTHAHKVCRL